jgi:hypothetical protein
VGVVMKRYAVGERTRPLTLDYVLRTRGRLGSPGPVKGEP